MQMQGEEIDYFTRQESITKEIDKQINHAQNEGILLSTNDYEPMCGENLQKLLKRYEGQVMAESCKLDYKQGKSPTKA